MSVLPRQAVVIVHGIGEQRPLETLRSFVGTRKHQGIIPLDEPRFSSPDNLLGTFYERRIKVCWDQTDTVQKLPSDPPNYQWRMANTDIFELYWAYRYRDSNFAHIMAWAVPRLRRQRRTLFTPRLLGPPRPYLRYTVVLLTLLSITAWFAAKTVALHALFPTMAVALSVALPIVVGVLLLAAAFWLAGRCGLLSFIRFGFLLVISVFIGVLLVLIRGDVTFAAAIKAIVGSSVVSAIVGAVAGSLVKSLGDAARYLDNSPANLTESEAIKKQAVELLDALHTVVDEEHGRPAYDRVVVVGHSLGTLVAYDAIRHLWAQRHQQLPIPEVQAAPGAAEVRKVERAGEDLVHEPDSESKRSAYREAQLALSHYLRNPVTPPGGDPPGRWIISDFVTLACPLAHADLLVASSRQDFERLKEERLLATNPPSPQRIAAAASRPYRFRRPARGSGPALTYLHHAAPFAAVRWTNLYFAHDVVGGPLAGVLGPGIEDHQLGTFRSFADMVLHYPHSSYWGTKRPPGFWGRFNLAGAEETRALLSDLVRRPVTLLLSVAASTPPAVMAFLQEQLEAPPRTAAGLMADVQLFLRGEDGQREHAWFPLRNVPVPDRSRLRFMRGGLPKDDGNKITLLISPNIVSGSPVQGAPGEAMGTAEPGTEAEMPEQEETSEEREIAPQPGQLSSLEDAEGEIEHE